MSDFYQTGLVATFHRLGKPKLEQLEAQLASFARQRPMALVLPALYSEVEGPALPGIIEELKAVQYLNQVVVTMGGANKDEFKHAKNFFADLPQRPMIIWNTGPRINALYDKLESAGMNVGGDGKGRSCWMAYGYLLACQRSQVIALHDCDIVNYSRELLARLIFPVANPNTDYEFSKGFYARVTDRMYGRATRLLITPLIRSLQEIVGFTEFLRYLDSFRYPLSGEFCMQTDLARANRIPSDWGLEIGVLAEVRRNTSIKRVCQVDIAENYEHKHQCLSPRDPEKGLLRMCIDVTKTLFRTLAAQGVELTQGRLKTLQAAYVRMAEDSINRYQGDAWINGLEFDRHTEETVVDTFVHGIRLAAEKFYEDPMGVPLIPNWNRVVSAFPNFFAELREAVEADNERSAYAPSSGLRSLEYQVAASQSVS
jgi:glucosyl-3-phosphoglycerate synthase